MNLSNGDYAFVLAQVALLNCRVEGMKAENRHRIACGNSIAYGEEEFRHVESEFESLIGCNAILAMRINE